jgi:hypothetical protein
MKSTWVLVFALVALAAAGCSGDRVATPTGARTSAEAPHGGGPAAPAPASGDCTFRRGVTTCQTTTGQHTETGTHQEVSGCLAFNGTTFVPGQRTRTFSDQYLVSEVTTTRQHGRHGAIFDTAAGTTRELQSSTLVSDQCVAI